MFGAGYFPFAYDVIKRRVKEEALMYYPGAVTKSRKQSPTPVIKPAIRVCQECLLEEIPYTKGLKERRLEKKEKV